MTEKLKPCPFCGDKGILIEAVNGETKGVYISCIRRGNIFDEPKCPVEPMTTRWGTNAKERAIEAWNNRPNPWHTGTPTEDGWYLCAYDNDFYLANYWCRCGWLKQYRGENLLSCDGLLAWQKIEPFKETE